MRASHSSIVLALAAALAATACGGAPKSPVAEPPPSPHATPTTSPTATPTEPASPTASTKPTKPAPILTDERTIALGFTAAQIVPAGPVVYVVGGDSRHVTVARIDVTAKTVTAQRNLPGVTPRASVGGGTLAVLIPGRPARLALLDLRTLAVTATRSLPVAADVLARPEAVYVSTPGQIVALDPSTLQVRRTMHVDDYPEQQADGATIAADPRSHILYAGVPNSGGPRVDAVDLRTGRLLARHRVDGVATVQPQGYGDDSWAVFATGMMAAAELVTPTGHVRTTLYEIGPNFAAIAVTGRRLWTFAPPFNEPIVCRDLDTGAVQGSTTQPGNLYPAAADNTHVYLADGNALRVYTPSGACA